MADARAKVRSRRPRGKLDRGCIRMRPRKISLGKWVNLSHVEECSRAGQAERPACADPEARKNWKQDGDSRNGGHPVGLKNQECGLSSSA